ncbi:hypothetical protein GBAR_LOCUS31335 [Geodia barretti]|uniref:Death domain-containing protein n=1 Tax=Geodia barretti TaxID=519541 RepID=A0AA35U2E7_GEOBA|nr:hypothetical protein GBAR_LOCUS31335 [Geodia barretti]
MADVKPGRRSPHSPRRGKRYSKHVPLSRRKSPESSRSRRGKRSVPLTLSNVMREVREVGNWWGERGLGYYLYIPPSKREEIRQKFPDEMEQKKQLISHWINTDPLASRRRLIWALDQIEETKMADSIRSYAEPLTACDAQVVILPTR